MERLTIILGGILFAMCIYYLMLVIKNDRNDRPKWK